MRFFKPSKRNTPDATKPAGETRVPTGEFTAGLIALDDSIKAHNEEVRTRARHRAQDLTVAVDDLLAHIYSFYRSAWTEGAPLAAPLPAHLVEQAGNIAAKMSPTELRLFSNRLYLADCIELGDIYLDRHRDAIGHFCISPERLQAYIRAESVEIDAKIEAAKEAEKEARFIVPGGGLLPSNDRFVAPAGNQPTSAHEPMFVAPDDWDVEDGEADQEAEDADDFDANQLREDLFGAMHGASAPDDNDELYIKLDRPSDKAVVEAFLKRIAQEPPRYPGLASSASVDVLHEPNLSDLSNAAYETAAASLLADETGGYTSADLAGTVHQESIRYLAPRDGLTDAQIGEMIRRGQEHPAAPVQIPGFTNHAQFNLEELADEMAAVKPTEEDAAAIAALTDQMVAIAPSRREICNAIQALLERLPAAPGRVAKIEIYLEAHEMSMTLKSGIRGEYAFGDWDFDAEKGL